MSFNIETFKKSLAPFGTVVYARIFNQGQQSEYLEFAVSPVNYQYTTSNWGVFTETQILPYYPKLINISMDTIRLKGAFGKV